MDILGVLLGAGQVQRQPQHGLIVLPDEGVERRSRALLRLADRVPFLWPRLFVASLP